MQERRILVTGAAGFIGKHLMDRLKTTNLDNCVIGVDVKPCTDDQDLWSMDISYQANEVNDLFARYKFTDVWHCAAYAAEVRSHYIRSYLYQNNLVGFANILNAFINNGGQRFFNISSAAVYGESALPSLPIDPYGLCKATIERDLEIASRMFDFDCVSFRPHNVYGPGQSMNDPHRNVVARFIRAALTNTPAVLYGLSCSRQFSYIDDVVSAMLVQPNKIPEQWINRSVNIGSDATYSIAKLAEIVSNEFDNKLTLVIGPERKEARIVECVHDMMRKLYTKPFMDLESGVRLTVNWAKQMHYDFNEDSIKIPPNEINKDLPAKNASVIKGASESSNQETEPAQAS